MPPKARRVRRPAPKPKAKAWVQTSNARQRERRTALALLNELADDVGVRKIRAKSKAVAVEQFVRILEKRCHTDDRHERLRAAVELYTENGGVFSVPLETAPDIPSYTDMQEDGECSDIPHVQQHRVLQAGFRIKSKAFMLTFNSLTITMETWPAFRKWVRQKCGFKLFWRPDAKRQAPDMPDLLLHETAVSWVRNVLRRMKPEVLPWKKSPVQWSRRMVRAVDEANQYDVEALCTDFPDRIQECLAADGAKLSY